MAAAVFLELREPIVNTSSSQKLVNNVENFVSSVALFALKCLRIFRGVEPTDLVWESIILRVLLLLPKTTASFFKLKPWCHINLRTILRFSTYIYFA